MDGSASLLALLAILSAAANEIKLVHVDACLTHLLAGFFVLPRIIFQFAANERLFPLAVEFCKSLSTRTPKHTLSKICLLALFARVAIFPLLTYSDAELSHSGAVWKVFSFRISREIALQDHDVHFFFLVGCFSSFFGGDHAMSGLSPKYGAVNLVT